jgi:diguanylate cyclase (GGDEF)-like protein
MDKILVVDDDITLIRLLKTRLEAEKYEVFTASNGEEALRILDKKGPDLIILDIMMPGIDGFETCRRIRLQSAHRHLPVIMLTAKHGPSEKVKGLDMGADDYMTKPYESDELLARIRAGLRARREYKRMMRMAERDALTGLYNRRSFDRRLAEEFSRAERYNRELSLVMLDIDHFKTVNDTYGHPMGDIVLKQVADLIQMHIRKSDISYRYGGEEFVILAPETDVAGVEICAERTRASCEKFHFGKGKKPISITISEGFSCYQRDSASSPEDLLCKADSALYQAKARGGNCVAAATPQGDNNARNAS